MNKNIHIIRHCEAEGQAFDASLTKRGFKQANELADFLAEIKMDRVISSPFFRAIQTIKPFTERENLEVELDHRLTERVLSSTSFPDWMSKLEATFEDMDLKYEGGESNHEAMNRIVEVVDDIVASDSINSIIVAHGGIISSLLNNYDKRFGFEQWRSLSNPDVYVLRITEDGTHYNRIWQG